MSKKYTTDEIHVGGHNLNAPMMVSLNSLIEGGLHSNAGYLLTSGGALTGPLTITGDGSYLGNWGYNTLILHDTAGYPGINFRNGNTSILQRMRAGSTDMQWAYSTNASGQGTGAYTDGMKLSGNSLTLYGDVRSPTFYDSNNTAYYTDPGSTSRTNSIISNIFSGDISTSGDGQNNYPFRLRYDWNAYMMAAANNTWGLFWAGSNGARYGTNGNGGPGNIWSNSTNPNEFVFVGSDSTAWTVHGSTGNVWLKGYGTAAGSYRAPIFYDSNNTGYYLNPDGTSNLNVLRLDGDLDMKAQVGTWITSGIMSDAIGWNSSYGVYIGSNVGGSHYLRGNGTFTTGGSTYNLWHAGNDGSGSGLDADLLDGQQGTYYAPATGGSYLPLSGGTLTGDITVGSGQTSSNIYMADSDGTARRIHTNSNRIGFLTSGNGWGSYCSNNGDWVTDFVSYAGASMRAPIFYDNNNTNYRIDPGATDYSGVFRQHVTIGDSSQYKPNSGNWGARLNVVDDVHAKITVGQDANDMLSVWYAHTGHSSIKFGTESSHNVEFVAGNATRLTVDTGGNVEATTSLRAPIFYDSNDTNYYLNPNGHSKVSTLEVATSTNIGANYAYKDVYVGGDADTYYPVRIDGSGGYGFHNYSVSRRYNWNAPTTWNTASHRGGLTFTFQWSSDTGWGGNHKSIRVTEFQETYSTMLGGITLPVTGGVMVWLRGGSALYRIHTPKGSSTAVTVELNGYTASNGTFYGTRTSPVPSEWEDRWPIRRDNDSVNVTNGYIGHVLTAGASVSSPIYYDLNNTGYYLNPASTSNLNGLTVAATITGNISGNAVTAGNADTVDGHHASTTRDLANTIPIRNQYGYIDLGWINTTSGNTTSTLSDIYVNTNDGYIRKATPAHFRSQITDGVYLPIGGKAADSNLLDGIDSSSFLRSDVDDSFTGNLTTGANNYITFGPNTAWGSSLRVGGNGHTATGTEMASVVTTDGNLHLDSADSSNAIYLNYYAGILGTKFGNGNSGIVGSVSGSGLAIFNDSVRSPIFYDSNDTTYYLNPNGQSKIRNNNAQEALIIEGDYPQLTIRKTNVPDASIHFDAGYAKKFNIGPGAGGAEEDEFGFAIYSGPRGTHYGTPLRINAETGYVQVGDKDHPSYPLDVLGTAYSSADFRAPTFYDSNNTAYYTNPASTSNLNSLNVATINRNPVVTLSGDVTGAATMTNLGSINITTVVADDSHSHSQIHIPDTRGAVRAPSYYPDRKVSFDFQHRDDTLAGGDPWHAIQTIAPWSVYSTDHRQQQLVFAGTGGVKFRYATSESAWAGWNRFYADDYHPNADRWTSSIQITIGGVGRNIDGTANATWSLADIGALGATATAANSTQFNGLNSSRFVYGGEARKSNQVSTFAGASEPSGFYYGSNITGAPTTDWVNYIHSVGNSWSSNNNYSFQLTHAFHTDNLWVSRTTNGTQSSARLILDGGGIHQTKSGILQSNASMRAPVFNDSNNTAYYVNPAGTTSAILAGNVGIGTTSPDSLLHVDGEIRWAGGEHNPAVLSGTNNEITIKSTTYLPLILGANSSNALLLDPNDTVYKLGDYDGDNNETYLEIDDDGQLTTLYNSGLDVQGSIWSTSQVTANNSMRAPLFYDKNNTSYYVNPAATSELNVVTLKNSTIPFKIKVNTGYRSWATHIGGTSSYIIVPSTANGNETWSWTNALDISTGGVCVANAFNLRSDERLKENIVPLPEKSIDVEWKSFNKIGDDTKRSGVIAQELEENHPEFVTTDEKGFKSVNYIDLLVAKIAELETRIKQLENN